MAFSGDASEDQFQLLTFAYKFSDVIFSNFGVFEIWKKMITFAFSLSGTPSYTEHIHKQFRLFFFPIKIHYREVFCR